MFLLLASSACTAVLEPDDGARNPAAQGGISGGSAGAGAGGAGTASGAGAAAAGVGSAACGTPSAAALHARLLTPPQYDHTVEDLFKVTGNPARDFGGGVAARLDEVGVERRANAAAEVASKAAATLAAWAPCLPPAVPAAECGARIIDRLGSLAFRRPLAEPERAQLGRLFEAGLAEKDFATGVEWLLTGLLQSPDFLYQFAKPTVDEVAGQVVPLSAYELASRLAFFVWDGAPDEALLAAAGAGRLNDAMGRAQELERLMKDARFARGTSEFYREWLGLKGFKELARDDPAFTTELVGQLQQSLLTSATALYASATPNIAGLFSGQSYYLTDKLRAFYGLQGGSAVFEPVELANQGRRGILTHPGLMALLARPSTTNPIARGLFLQRTLLCNEVPPPPQGIAIPPLGPDVPGLTTRERLEHHVTEPLCQGCHAQIDPPGFALENYDAVGRFRTHDAGKPVDSSGEMRSGRDVDGGFTQGGQLLDRLAQSADVKRCFAQHYLTFAVARELSPEDSCSLMRVASDFEQSGDLKRLVESVAQSDVFRLRATEGLGAKP